MENNENKSLGGALVDVFDAALSLVKTEINTLVRRVADIAKVKGLGLVLVLASLVPLSLALIFLILFVFYGLMRLGLGAWAAALLIALVSFALTGALIFLGIKRLGAEVPDDGPSGPMSDIARDDLTYGAKPESTTSSTTSPAQGAATTVYTPASTAATQTAGTTTPPGSAHASQTHATAPAYVSSSTSHSSPVQSSTAPGGLQSTSTQGKPSAEPEVEGVPVSTNPTYREDMKKEGY